jgi:hypothetical protein
MVEYQPEELKARRQRVQVTAWILAAVAGTVFIAFVLSGVLGQ